MNNKRHLFTGDKDFLQNEKFIRWRLFRTPESDDYWNKLLSNNPHLEEAVQAAIAQFDKIEINQYFMSKQEKKEMYATVLHKVHKHKKRRLLVRVSSVAAIFLAALLSVLHVTLFKNNTDRLSVESNTEMIVGHTLPGGEIHIISGEQKIDVINQSNIGLTADGKVLITDSMDSKKELLLAKTTINTLVVPYGKRTNLTLTDGTKVWLNSGSVLEFPTQFTRKDREINLVSGEIYIEVSSDKQKPFHVQTSNFNVRVHGTKFNIAAYTNSPQSVVLVEGSISLKSKNEQKIILKPNEQAIYTKKGLFNATKVDVAQFISWKDGYLILDDTPISEVLKKIERYYNLSFDYDEDIKLQKRTCIGKIHLSENLDNVMTTLALLSRTKYIRENNQIRITHNPQ